MACFLTAYCLCGTHRAHTNCRLQIPTLRIGICKCIHALELVSKVSSAAVDDMRAATSSNFAKESSVYLSGYTSGFFARFPRLAWHLANLATKLLLRPVLVSPNVARSCNLRTKEKNPSHEVARQRCLLHPLRRAVTAESLAHQTKEAALLFL
jgi:hypothetical protein